MPTRRPILERLEAGLRAAGAQGRETVTIPAFQVFIASSESYHMNLAVPCGPEPADWTPALEALRQVFRNHARRPRLEFFRELHPSLEAALERVGFRREMVAPVMTLGRAGLAEAPAEAAGTYLRLTHAHAAELESFLRRQHLAYGGRDDDSALAWLSSLSQGLRDGSVLAAGLELHGELVTGATVILGGDVAELAGVWTLPERQRQGLAYRLCHRLLADYFAAGHDLCWLSAAEGAQGLYARLGFETVGTQLNYGEGAPPRPDVSR